MGVLATRLLMFLDQLDGWRRTLLSSHSLSVVADLGYGVLDAVVEPAAFVILAGQEETGVFLRLLSASDKEAGLLAASGLMSANRDVHAVPNRWDRIPGYRIAYWAPTHWLDLFRKHPLEGFARVSKGFETGDDERFLRLGVEVPAAALRERWWRYAKGGDYQPVAGNCELVVDHKLLPVARRTTDADIYGVAGITYTQRTTSFLSFRALPAEFVFSPGGPGIIPHGSEHLGLLLSFLNSRPIGALVELCVGSGDSAVRGSAARNYTTGIIKRLPCLISSLGKDQEREVRQAIRERCRWTQEHQLAMDELSPTFHGLPPSPSPTLGEIAMCRARLSVTDALRVLDADWRVDGLWRDVLGYSHADTDLLDTIFGRHPTQCRGGHLPDSAWSHLLAADTHEDDGEAPTGDLGRQQMKRSHIVLAELESLALRFDCSPARVGEHPRFCEALVAAGGPICRLALSSAVGHVFGRWDIRYATGERQVPELPDPFAPLPVCPPGQLQNAAGLPAEAKDVPADYPIDIPWDGILVDDPGHPRDIEARMRRVLEVIWQDRAGAIEQEACEILGVRSLRDYFAKPARFFADHLQRYSKSRRKAPIYWPLSTPSGSYTLWIYYHRLTDQTLYTCVNDVVEPKLRQVADSALQLRQKADRSIRDEKDLERLADLELELREFREELLRLAPIWKPNLNDGVQITAAPLWRLFQHRPWQKILKETWQKLEKGDYDWAHLAYSLWPDRVRDKCRTDKSLAIAHDLEALYVEPPPSAKKKRGRRKRADSDVEEGTMVPSEDEGDS